MRHPKIVDWLMNFVGEETRYRWCDAGACACMGCINGSAVHIFNQLQAEPITYEEWLDWKERHELIEIIYNGEHIEKTANEWIRLCKQNQLLLEKMSDKTWLQLEEENKVLRWQVEDLTNKISHLERKIENENTN